MVIGIAIVAEQAKRMMGILNRSFLMISYPSKIRIAMINLLNYLPYLQETLLFFNAFLAAPRNPLLLTPKNPYLPHPKMGEDSSDYGDGMSLDHLVLNIVCLGPEKP